MSRARIVLVLFASAAALAVAAGCGGDDADGSATPAATSSSVPFDRAFIDAMVPHHESAIEMAETALAAGLSQPDLVDVANDIVESQQAEIDQMLSWREEWFGSSEIDPEGASALGLSDEAMGMEHGTSEIEDADDVDRAFAAAMIPHHEGAIRMAELARERGQHEEIRSLAEGIISAQQAEIETLEPHAGGHHGS
jgi:uncharacterized protein (DUF305 family)